MTDWNRQAYDDCVAEFSDSFMKPKFYLGEAIQMELMEAGLDVEDDKIYCRLSTDGYLDCTDWHGPFSSVEAAAHEFIETYKD
jgi:hypothetical protein